MLKRMDSVNAIAQWNSQPTAHLIVVAKVADNGAQAVYGALADALKHAGQVDSQRQCRHHSMDGFP